MKFIRCLFAICGKDLLSELRRREILNSILFFSVLTIFLFSFAMGSEPTVLRRLAPGFLWLVILFSSVLALERAFQAEVEEGCLDRLVLYCVSPRAIFLGKLLTNFFFIAIIGFVVLFMMMILFDLGRPKNLTRLVVTMLLGNGGIATLGTFYAALTTKTRAREVILPLLLYPMLIPLFLASVYATQHALQGDPFDQAVTWLKLLVVFDGVFIAACLMAIGPLIEG